MATQFVNSAYAQNKGTLVPGQTIAVNKYTVQVERYLSQGGFAHVYLVRTPTPVYGTTHHVLKRIAVSNESMLTEVKKEVDIMRLLQGHPNIVHLIDAAWHRMSNGLFEVFILMEYCPGGGIIDMMNRRLRERLTEAEILQIFVDVCEGVAHMHNMRPPLLHRDLKVENILQSSPASYKLCDFGSAATVATRPPATTQEIRALEADLNRHTTLQYRAPEMVDPYLRRPVDEKSDIWALGVLLYKLCYYTTPFEEHGPLAILNVQYRIPPYPAYSSQMNSLIASMLREHGTQRPSVFEILNHVHSLRGTKSHFTYNIPVPIPLSPRHQAPMNNSLDSAITYRTVQPMVSVVKRPEINGILPSMGTTQGAQAREKVLEAIAPMRRGRPIPAKDALPSSRPITPLAPQRQVDHSNAPDKHRNWLDGGFGTEGDKAWNNNMDRKPSPAQPMSDGWVDAPPKSDHRSFGFGDNYTDTKVWVLQNPNSPQTSKASPQPPSAEVKRLYPTSQSTASYLMRPPAFTGTDALRSREAIRLSGKDAFESLGVSSEPKPAPTLGEARKLRTGLAMMSAGNAGSHINTVAQQLESNRATNTNRSQYFAQAPGPQQAPGPAISANAFRTPQNSRPPSVLHQGDSIPPESRFPSLADLDASFALPSMSSSTPRLDLYSSAVGSQLKFTPALSVRPNQAELPTTESMLKPAFAGQSSSSRTMDIARAEYAAAKAAASTNKEYKASEPKLTSQPSIDLLSNTNSNANQARRLEPTGETKSQPFFSNSTTRPSLSRTEGRSMAMSMALQGRNTSEKHELTRKPDVGVPSNASLTKQAHDWLTGDIDIPSATLDLSSSFSQSVSGTLTSSSVPKERMTTPSLNTKRYTGNDVSRSQTSPLSAPPPEYKEVESPTYSRFARTFPPINSSDSSNSPTSLAPPETSTSKTGNSAGRSGRWSPRPESSEKWHPGATPNSSGDEGPEEAHGYTTQMIKHSGLVTQRSEPMGHKARQSSVHDLVDLWGGSPGVKERDREKEPTRATLGQGQGSSYGLHRTTSREAPAPSPFGNTYDSSHGQSPNLLSPRPGYTSTNIPGRGEGDDQPRRPSPSPSPPGRTRPQSMFIFPSRPANLESTPTNNISSGLIPPEDINRRASNMRRTSISDMVQKFEAMGRTNSGTGPPSPLSTSPRATSFKINASVDAGRFGSRALIGLAHNGNASNDHEIENSIKSPSQSLGLPANNNFPSSNGYNNTSGDPVKRRTSPTTRISPIASRPHPLPDTSPVTEKYSNEFPLRARTPSFKPSERPIPPRRTTYDDNLSSSITLASTAPASPDEGPSSPERPYQGVGRLIDQWQRKSEEAQVQTVPSGAKRTPFVAKRGAASGKGS